MFKLFVKFLILTTILMKCTLSARILAIFPTPSISHQIVFRALTQDLSKRGHELTILTPDPVHGNNPNVTEIDLSASYKTFKELFNYGEFKDIRNNEVKFIRKAAVIFERLMNEQLSHPDVKDLILNHEQYHFDLMIIEHTGYIPLLAFAEIYDCPVVGITSFEAASFTYQMFGNEANPVIHPEQNFPYAHGELTFVQRWKSLQSSFLAIFSLILPPSPILKVNELLATHFPQINKGLFELIDRVEVFMVNTNPALGFVRPLVPTTIQLGFMHIEPPKELSDKDLKTFMSKSQNGVIYVSFGSNIASKDLDKELIDILLRVIRNSKYDFVWKFEAEDFNDMPANLHISKWLPQADLLAHQNMRLFISQCGHQSIEEAVDRTIPLICVPFLGDQPGIAKKLEQKGVAHLIELDAVTKDELNFAIIEMMKPFYKENIRRLRDQVYDQPMPSREKAVWWVEYVIRHKGAKHLAYAGRLVPFHQKYWLDFIAIAIVSVLIIRKMTRNIFKRVKKSKTE